MVPLSFPDGTPSLAALVLLDLTMDDYEPLTELRSGFLRYFPGADPQQVLTHLRHLVAAGLLEVYAVTPAILLERVDPLPPGLDWADCYFFPSPLGRSLLDDDTFAAELIRFYAHRDHSQATGHPPPRGPS